MTVFKNYFKIISKHLLSISIYLIIFLVMMLMFSKSGNSNSGDYRSVDVELLLYDDSKSSLSRVLVEYIGENFDVKDFPERLAEDELFYGGIQAIIRIPKSFEEDYRVDYKSSPKSAYGQLVKQKINSFINTLTAYKGLGLTDEEAREKSLDDLRKKSRVKLVGLESREAGYHTEGYFNFLNYVIMSQLILIISLVMTAYKEEVIYKRNAVSSFTNKSLNLQLVMGHLTVGIGVWAMYMILFAIIWPKALSLRSTPYMMANSLVFTSTVVSMAALISKLVSNRNALAGIMNIISLGSSFISGAMVPQDMLSETTLSFSKFLPSYYYIANNNNLVKNPSFSTMATNLFIMLGFSILFVILSSIVKPRAMRD